MKRIALAALFSFSLPIIAAAAPVELDGGVQLRFRYEAMNHLPSWPNGESGKSDVLRLRTRVWGRADAGDFGLFVRLGNEFRHYRHPRISPAQHRQKFPDVTFFDNLYFEARNLGDCLDLRVGRQSLNFGAGRIVSDGTGADGSRTDYFDAVRATLRLTPKTSLDFFGLYTAEEDWLPDLGRSYAASGEKVHYNPSGFSNAEAGAGVYAQIRESQALGVDLYWIWKHESASPKFAGRDIQTLGFRLLPRFTPTLSAELEAAGQFGQADDDQDLCAWMVYGGLTYAPAFRWNPNLTAACLYLSGDDRRFDAPQAGTDTGWNPMFNRRTWLGDTLAPMYDKNRYSNLVYPHISASATPAEGHTLSLQTGPLFTARTEQGVNSDPGFDSFRGVQILFTYHFPIVENLFGERGSLSGGITLEYLAKGNYFADADDASAYYAMFELLATF